MFFQSNVRLAHYELRDELGSGQYGVVKLGKWLSQWNHEVIAKSQKSAFYSTKSLNEVLNYLAINIECIDYFIRFLIERHTTKIAHNQENGQDYAMKIISKKRLIKRSGFLRKPPPRKSNGSARLSTVSGPSSLYLSWETYKVGKILRALANCQSSFYDQ